MRDEGHAAHRTVERVTRHVYAYGPHRTDGARTAVMNTAILNLPT